MKKKILFIIFYIFIIKCINAEEIKKDATIITTDGGIKVFQDEKYYDLEDNVNIDSKNFDLEAKNVIAYYDKDFYDLTKIIATGNAKIVTSEGAQINGDKIIYEIKSGNFLIMGNGLFINEGLIVRGEDIQGKIVEIDKVKYIEKVEAKDSEKVFIQNNHMKSYSKSAIYLKENNVLELFDEVKIIKDQEITTGDYANINLKTNDYTIKSINNKVKLLINSDN